MVLLPSRIIAYYNTYCQYMSKLHSKSDIIDRSFRIPCLVGTGRLELPRIAPYAPEAYAYTNSATCPTHNHTKRKTGFNPVFLFRCAIQDPPSKFFRRHSKISGHRIVDTSYSQCKPTIRSRPTQNCVLCAIQDSNL